MVSKMCCLGYVSNVRTPKVLSLFFQSPPPTPRKRTRKQTTEPAMIKFNLQKGDVPLPSLLEEMVFTTFIYFLRFNQINFTDNLSSFRLGVENQASDFTSQKMNPTPWGLEAEVQGMAKGKSYFNLHQKLCWFTIWNCACVCMSGLGDTPQIPLCWNGRENDMCKEMISGMCWWRDKVTSYRVQCSKRSPRGVVSRLQQQQTTSETKGS